ncbi:MAG: DUF3108 domain-containing protein [bacterium]
MDGESRFPAIMPGEPHYQHPISRPRSLYSHFCVEKLDGASSSMQTLINRLALLCLMLPCALLAQSPSDPDDRYQPQILIPETLRYRMVSGRTEVGEMTVDIARDQAAGMIHVIESVSGLFERSTVFTLRDDSRLQPVSSSTVFGREPRFHAVRLQYSETNLTGEIEQPVEYGGKRAINLALPPATHDYFAVPHLLRARRLQVDEAISFAIFDFRQQRIDLARAWVVKNETVTVPAGDFVCQRVEGFSGKLRWILLIDETFPHRLVKQTFPAMEIELELAGWRDANTQAQKSSSLKLP